MGGFLNILKQIGIAGGRAAIGGEQAARNILTMGSKNFSGKRMWGQQGIVDSYFPGLNDPKIGWNDVRKVALNRSIPARIMGIGAAVAVGNYGVNVVGNNGAHAPEFYQDPSGKISHINDLGANGLYADQVLASSQGLMTRPMHGGNY